VHRGMKQQHLDFPVDVMLTPQFYTLKKETLPVKYQYQAKKIAPSLFDGLLETPEKYEYMVYREGDVWVFIAYDLEEITAFLEEKGIASEEVGKIFFVQQALAQFHGPVLLGEEEALVALNGTVVIVPQGALGDEARPIPFTEAFAPAKGVNLAGTHNSYLTRKQAISLAAVFTLFALLFFSEGMRYGNESESSHAEMQQLIEEHPSLQSQYTRDSISEKYRTIDALERKKREQIKALSGLIFKGVKASHFYMDDKKISIVYDCANANVAKRLLDLAKKVGMQSAKAVPVNRVEIEEKL